MTNEGSDVDDDSFTNSPIGGPDTLVSDIADEWNDVIADMETLATEYRDDGWDILEVHPGDVVPLSPNEDETRWGLDAVLPGNEITALENLIESNAPTLDDWDVFRTQSDNIVFLLVVARDNERGRMLFVPLYYHAGDASGMARAARERGCMQIHLRSLSIDPIVTLEQTDPELFLPK